MTPPHRLSGHDDLVRQLREKESQGCAPSRIRLIRRVTVRHRRPNASSLPAPTTARVLPINNCLGVIDPECPTECMEHAPMPLREVVGNLHELSKLKAHGTTKFRAHQTGDGCSEFASLVVDRYIDANLDQPLAQLLPLLIFVGVAIFPTTVPFPKH